jgi:hypothetical protein
LDAEGHVWNQTLPFGFRVGRRLLYLLQALVRPSDVLKSALRMHLESWGQTVKLCQIFDGYIAHNYFRVEITVSLAVAVSGGSCCREFVRVSTDVTIAGVLLIRFTGGIRRRLSRGLCCHSNNRLGVVRWVDIHLFLTISRSWKSKLEEANCFGASQFKLNTNTTLALVDFTSP